MLNLNLTSSIHWSYSYQNDRELNYLKSLYEYQEALVNQLEAHQEDNKKSGESNSYLDERVVSALSSLYSHQENIVKHLKKNSSNNYEEEENKLQIIYQRIQNAKNTVNKTNCPTTSHFYSSENSNISEPSSHRSVPDEEHGEKLSAFETQPLDEAVFSSNISGNGDEQEPRHYSDSSSPISPKTSVNREVETNYSEHHSTFPIDFTSKSSDTSEPSSQYGIAKEQPVAKPTVFTTQSLNETALSPIISEKEEIQYFYLEDVQNRFKDALENLKSFKIASELNKLDDLITELTIIILYIEQNIDVIRDLNLDRQKLKHISDKLFLHTIYLTHAMEDIKNSCTPLEESYQSIKAYIPEAEKDLLNSLKYFVSFGFIVSDSKFNFCLQDLEIKDNQGCIVDSTPTGRSVANIGNIHYFSIHEEYESDLEKKQPIVPFSGSGNVLGTYDDEVHDISTYFSNISIEELTLYIMDVHDFSRNKFSSLQKEKNLEITALIDEINIMDNHFTQYFEGKSSEEVIKKYKNRAAILLSKFIILCPDILRVPESIKVKINLKNLRTSSHHKLH